MVKPLAKSSNSRGRTIDAFLRFTGLTCNGDLNAKGNKGRGAAQRRFKLLAVILVMLVCLLGVIHLCFLAAAPSTSRFNHHVRHAKKLRPRDKLVPPIKSGGINRYRSQFTNRQILDFIISGKLNLVDIEVDKRELEGADDDTYDGVYGIFCHLNFTAHKADPSGVPMFRDLLGKSPLCEGKFDPENEDDILQEDEEDIPRGRVRINLKMVREMAKVAEDHGKFPQAKNLKLAGVAFHESRCGSTLVANSLIAMNPAKHRVYSESPPPLAALTLCSRALDGDEGGACSIGQGAQILQDVLYFMGRSQDPQEERFFLKIQSIGTRSLKIFRLAFPSTPWIFVYRDPVQVMMSHFAHGKRQANCLRQMQHPPRILLKLVAEKQRYLEADNQADDAEEAKNIHRGRLSPEEYCAAHLATLTETAAKHIQEGGGLGRAINYVSLPQVMYEEVLPAWGIQVSSEEIQNIQEISGHYSKGRGEQKKEWQEDSQKKEEMATPEIQDAAKMFLRDSFNVLETLSKVA